MKRQVKKGPRWDQRLEDRWRSLPRSIQCRWVAGSFLLYVLLAAIVLLQARRELADASPPDLGRIRNPVAEEADNSSKKKSNERKAAEQTGDLHQRGSGRK